MFLEILLIIILILVLMRIYSPDTFEPDTKEDTIEGFWYYPNCMETVFGGIRCYPYYYYPYRRYYYPLYPWTYYW